AVRENEDRYEDNDEDVLQEPVRRIDRVDRHDDPKDGVDSAGGNEENIVPEIRADAHCRGRKHLRQRSYIPVNFAELRRCCFMAFTNALRLEFAPRPTKSTSRA